MKPLSSWPDSLAIRYLFFDIDDTFSTEGKIGVAAWQALWSLQAQGIQAIAVTGRPAGWCDHIARMWPVRAVVGENGAFYFLIDPLTRKMRRHYWQARGPNPAQFAAVLAQVQQQIPRAQVAADQAYRLFDLAIDFAEEVDPPLSASEVQQIVQIFAHHQARAKVSSIHVNGWWGDYDKLAMVHHFALAELGLNLANPSHRCQCLFCGDSPNDEPMFAFFENSVGVANIKAFIDQLTYPPRYITTQECGEGFAELCALFSKT